MLPAQIRLWVSDRSVHQTTTSGELIARHLRHLTGSGGAAGTSLGCSGETMGAHGVRLSHRSNNGGDLFVL